MNKVIILTGDEKRHEFFRKYMGASRHFQVLKSYCEQSEPERIIKSGSTSELRRIHLESRKQTELDFFGVFTEKIQDHSNPKFIPRGLINDPKIQEEIILLNPDYILSYGCSIIKGDLISAFPNRFINIHLGLSPYYRGSGTNYWPLVNEEPQFVGTTFMYIDEGVDTGQIIHQIRGRIYPLDTVHTIGNRLIQDTAAVAEKIIENSEKIIGFDNLTLPENEERYYMNKDFSEESVVKLYNNFENGMISEYLENVEKITKSSPIIQNPNFF